MPYDNRFRHQRYEVTPSPELHHFVPVERLPDPDSPEARHQVVQAGRTLRAAGVRRIYLVHGTLTGTDVSGLYREIKRIAPRMGRALGGTSKQLVDLFARDMGNYTEDYVLRLQEGINETRQPAIQVKRFVWSSENNHTGRAIAALQLLVELAGSQPVRGRMMLWGHSHAGNVFALLTNLLGGDLETRSRFLSCFEDWLERRDPEVWQQAQALLMKDEPILDEPLDIVTLGTPIRYGWERRGYHTLQHFINHHPLGSPPEVAPFPPTAEQLRESAAGDYFQQMFIAGTNFMPGLWSWGQWKVERHLRRLIQADVSSRALVPSLRHGRRVPAEGRSLLVDYGLADATARSLAGHAVYTRLHWLPFHAHHIAEGCQ